MTASTLSQACARDILENLLNKTAGGLEGPHTTIYVGLSTADPGETLGGLAEPSGNGYARFSMVAADWTAPSDASPSVSTNVNVEAFPAATGSWGTVTHFTLWTHLTLATTTEYIGSGALTASKAVGDGDTVEFAIGDLSISVD